MRKWLLLLTVLLPASLLATTAGAPIRRTGAPVDDNGQTCRQCHTSFELNSPGGFVMIEAFHYRPGQKQTIRVTVAHAEAVKWGFQLTARRAEDPTQKAGTFSVSSNYRLRCADGRDANADSPCANNMVEFAGHYPPVVFGGVNGAKTFEVEWNAPAEDIGNVIFYAAGNAANNNGNNQGDRIYTDSLVVEPLGRSCGNTIRPTLRTVTNAASGSREISMNSLISIWGMNFSNPGISRTAYRADLRNGYPTELGCVAVEIGGVRAPVFYVQPDQINAQVPTMTATGAVPVTVILNPGRPNEMRSDVGTLTITNYSPAFFTFNGRSIAARHTDNAIAADPSVVSGGRTVRAGDVLQLFATGLGWADWQAGEIPNRISSLQNNATVTVGGTTLPASDILYAGLAPGFISGLYQINIRLPQILAPGEVPVVVTIGGVSSPAGTTIPVREQ